MESRIQKTMTRRKRKYVAPIGGIFIILVAIGLFAVLVFSLKLTFNFIDNSDQKVKFENKILPVLMFDPVPYEKPTDVVPQELLRASLWATLLGDKRGSYPYDELKLLIVPASDIDVSAVSLFGPDVKLEHQTFGDYESSFIYDETTKTYHVPITGQLGLYKPRVEKITKKDNTLLLRVGYIPPDNIWNAEASNVDGEVQADKYMIYELTKYKNDYYISAIRDVEGAGVPNPDQNILPNVPTLPDNSLAPDTSLSDIPSGSSESDSQSTSGSGSNSASGSSSSSSSSSSGSSSSSSSSTSRSSSSSGSR